MRAQARIDTATRRAPAKTVGGYRLGPLIGSGHTARVFLGRKAGPGGFAKMAAIKIFDPSSAGDCGTATAFLAEARLTARVNHPHVRRVLDCGQAAESYFLVLDYVRGEPWSQVLSALSRDEALRPRLPVLAAHVFAQVCEGVYALHQVAAADDGPRGIVHGDLTPHNLMIGYDGSVHVLDLGAACAEGQHPASHCARADLRAYRAPEQMADSSVDRRADLWSLGVMLREAVSGESAKHSPARTGEDGCSASTPTATLREELGEDGPAAVAPELREIIEGALKRDLEARCFDARELGCALRRYLARAGEGSLEEELSRAMQRLFAKELERERTSIRRLAEEPRKALARAQGGNGSRMPKLAWVLGACAALAAGIYIGGRLVARPSSNATDRDRRPKAPPHLEMTESPLDLGTNERPKDLGAIAKRPNFGSIGQPADVVALEQRPDLEMSAAPPKVSSRTPAKSVVGVLVVGTRQGWAEVSASGVELGTTPLQTELPSGLQVLQVRPYGTGAAQRIRITVRPGRVTKLQLAL